MSIGQIGLLLDIFGFVIIFIFGGFQFGVRAYMADEYNWYVLPVRVLALVSVVIGFCFNL